jgi:hypothetical protein
MFSQLHVSSCSGPASRIRTQAEDAEGGEREIELNVKKNARGLRI